jgi:tetratricopeptide (TPR) repeat protein
MFKQTIVKRLKETRKLLSNDFAQTQAYVLKTDTPAEDALYHLSVISYEANALEQAVNSIKSSLCVNPSYPHGWYLLGRILFRQLNKIVAKEASARATLVAPLSAEFNASAGLHSLEASDFVSAKRLLEKAIIIDPSRKASNLDLGVLFNQADFPELALKLYRRESILSPSSPVPFFNSGNAEMSLGNPLTSAKNYDKALELGMTITAVYKSAALAHLVVGNFRRGWSLYESRFYSDEMKNTDTSRFLQSNRPLLTLSNEQTVHLSALVWGEQGVGDEVMFGSMLGEFRGMVGKLLVQLDRRLIPLFRRSLPDDVEFFERGTVVPEDRYDSHIAIGSLGQYLRPTLESFAGKGGKYLWADPERIQAMREWLSVKEGERVIGLSWRSSNPETGAARSLALSDLVKSLQAPGVRFVNLQYGDVAAEIEALERDEGIEVLQCPGLDATDDLDGLAALIEACDEVVSIGNATAHLAGALGKKTTVLLPKAPSWRWLAEGEVSPWYREMSLCRNADMSPWADFLAATFVVRGRCR